MHITNLKIIHHISKPGPSQHLFLPYYMLGHYDCNEYNTYHVLDKLIV